MELSEWKANLEKARERKDAYFAQGWQSPIPPEHQPRFKGLQYYPPVSNCRFELDLNNPWCAYNEAYTCPFAPTENWLEFPIPAGEKKYPLR